MPDRQQTIEDQASRNRRGAQLLDRRRAKTGDPYRKVLLLIIDDHVGGNSHFPITFSELAEETEMDVSSVHRKARELKDLGLIDYEETSTGSAVYNFRIIRSNVAELAEDRGPLRRKKKRGRPRNDQKKSLQPAKDFCPLQNDFAEHQNVLPTAKTFCTVQTAPYIERPSNDIQTKPITHAPEEPLTHAERPSPSPMRNGNGHGDGVWKNAFGGWDNPIETWQLTKVDQVQSRYEEAIRKGWLRHSEQTQINFFALSRYCGKAKGVKNPPAAFTFYLKREKWEVVRCEDLDEAGKAVRQLRNRDRTSEPVVLQVGLSMPAYERPDDEAAAERQKREFQKQAGGQRD